MWRSGRSQGCSVFIINHSLVCIIIVMCGVVKAIQLDVAKNAGVPSSSRLGKDNEVHFFDIGQWKQNMQAEYFVTVQWVEKDGRRVVDKLWSVSGKYKVLGRVGEGVCE